VCKSHCEAIEAVVTLPKTTADVGELPSGAHRAEKEQAREILRLILSSVRFLARQGLALRGRNTSLANCSTLKCSIWKTSAHAHIDQPPQGKKAC